MQVDDSPFTIAEVRGLIEATESAFRMYIRAMGQAVKVGNADFANECHRDAAETASILAELRHQRRIMEN